MSPKVTLDVLYALLDCRLKTYLRLTGEQGITSDYQSMLDRARQQARQTAIENIRNRYGHSITIERCPTRLLSEAAGPAAHSNRGTDVLQHVAGRVWRFP